MPVFRAAGLIDTLQEQQRLYDERYGPSDTTVENFDLHGHLESEESLEAVPDACP